jgi:AcrR family transcriptional regulator
MRPERRQCGNSEGSLEAGAAAAGERLERARIRRALIDLCFERGYPSLALEDLLERADVDHTTFRRFYQDLPDCFYNVYLVELEGFRARATRARGRVTTWRERVRVTAYALYRFLADDEKLRRLTTADVRSAGERVQSLFGEEVEALFDLIDQGRQEPGAPASLSRATAEQVGGGIFNQLYLVGARGGPMAAEQEIIPQLMYSVVLPYLGVAAAAEELKIPPPPIADC